MFIVMKEHATPCHAPLIDMLPVACHQGWSLIVSHSTTLVQVFQELVDCHEILHKQPCFSSPTIIRPNLNYSNTLVCGQIPAKLMTFSLASPSVLISKC